ncbi:hypothetical protein DENIS_4234 [Desulfonema ishimotonii]|uniref:Uncharacterized protein n=1 Tax=Desulfonema ishimotonii TaxID=45657 RepID=A0A401G202_9BACT|nr:hypothetical protein [Desulfonema ishimotonii]GBC63240.1 hypothetical protein DENIS_4234 [Desulfonema ishimotonii]
MNIILLIGLAMFFSATIFSLLFTRKYRDFTHCDQAREMGFQERRLLSARERQALRQLVRTVSQDPSDPYHDTAVDIIKLRKQALSMIATGLCLIILSGFFQSGTG